MANVNKVILIGNLTRDPEVRYTPKGTAVSDISLAVNRVTGGSDGAERREETTYVDITLWGRQAELAQQYLTKGRPVYIEGRLQMDTWEDKQSGQKRSKLKVVGEVMQFLGSPSGGGGGGSRPAPQQNDQQGGGYQQSDPAQSPQQSSPPVGGSPATPAFDDEDDDIPF